MKIPRQLLLSLLLILLMLSAPSMLPSQAQTKPPWRDTNWGAKLSAEHLYQPAWGIEFNHSEARFLALGLVYVFDAVKSRWKVQPAKHEYWTSRGFVQRQDRYGWLIPTSLGLLDARGVSGKTDDPEATGTLILQWETDSEPFARLVLWTKKQLQAAWPRAVYHVADPRVFAWEEEEKSIWLTIGFSSGEGSAGLGTIVEIVKSSNQVRIYQPDALALSSFDNLAIVGEELWLTSSGFGEYGKGPTSDIIRYNPATGSVRKIPARMFIGQKVTAMRRQGRNLWIVTDEGFTRMDIQTEHRRTWRIVAKVTVDKPVPLANLPGVGFREMAPPGRYEVRWVGEGYLEVLTPTCTEGLSLAGWFNHLKRRNFEQSPDAVAGAPRWGTPNALSLFTAPVPVGSLRSANPEAWFLRASAEAVGEEKDGWIRVRACAGWIEYPAESVQLTVVPVE